MIELQTGHITAAYFLHHSATARVNQTFPVGEDTCDTDNLLLCATCVKGQLQTVSRPDSPDVIWSSFEKNSCRLKLCLVLIRHLLCKKLYECRIKVACRELKDVHADEVKCSLDEICQSANYFTRPIKTSPAHCCSHLVPVQGSGEL